MYEFGPLRLENAHDALGVHVHVEVGPLQLISRQDGLGYFFNEGREILVEVFDFLEARLEGVADPGSVLVGLDDVLGGLQVLERNALKFGDHFGTDIAPMKGQGSQCVTMKRERLTLRETERDSESVYGLIYRGV